MLAKWNRKLISGELTVQLTLLGLPQWKVADETWLNTRIKMNSTTICSFQQDPRQKIGIMSNVNFTLSSNNNDELRELLFYIGR